MRGSWRSTRAAARLAWETIIGDRTEGPFGISSGPIVVGGKVLQGMGDCTLFRKEKCFISAYDAKDGRQLWKFDTVATTGTPGGDTWGDVQDLYRAGGDTWITGSYDPELDTTYWGVAQAKPWVPASRGNSALDRALYTSTTLALNPNDGSLKWYYQHAPGEALDLDEVYERVLDRRRRREDRLHDRQARHSRGSSIARAGGSSTTRRRSSRTSSTASIPRPASRATAPTLSPAKSASGCRAVPAPKAGTTGRR